ncbi:hypothetical protein, conserved [Trypanosoma brucei gambiense DAL972]|uniref:Uncharacterized protein n=1 Tax=Trypanosoma brucei gambiense (strain MHOM/CI/86/DAL972) TaxID=679716 RepID=D0A0K4_TRYB9|nr:LOW QUALITY PROTEIN: hypothetical protein, conserved [Trypanosoma brucei gambiense DAL972]CBH16762.1 hypothetical protein, conserved [Trypanosoma brucei gambiense DAL972]|eukprot:XP_011779026.1 LOW QUALITY PROTEIN: hypothetical protein, conserved [Trypanosoma brucei gambiense DAL972]
MYPKNKPLPPEAAGRAAELSNRNPPPAIVESNSSSRTRAFASSVPAPPMPVAPCGEINGTSLIRHAPGNDLLHQHASFNQTVPGNIMNAQRLSPVGSGSFQMSNNSLSSSVPHGPGVMGHSIKPMFPPSVRPPPPYAAVSPNSSGIIDERMLDTFGGTRSSHSMTWDVPLQQRPARPWSYGTLNKTNVSTFGSSSTAICSGVAQLERDYRRTDVGHIWRHPLIAFHDLGRLNQTPPPPPPPPLPPFMAELPPYPEAAAAAVPPPHRWAHGNDTLGGPKAKINGESAAHTSQSDKNGEVPSTEVEGRKSESDVCGEGSELLLQQYRSDVRFLTKLVVALLERMHPANSCVSGTKTEDVQKDGSDNSTAEDSSAGEGTSSALKKQLRELENVITQLQAREEAAMSPNTQRLFDRVLSIPQLTALASRVGGASGGALMPHRSVSSFGGSDDVLSLRVSSEVKAYMRAVDFETTRPLMLNVVVATDSAASSRTPSRTTSLQGVSAPCAKEETTTPL